MKELENITNNVGLKAVVIINRENMGVVFNKNKCPTLGKRREFYKADAILN